MRDEKLVRSQVVRFHSLTNMICYFKTISPNNLLSVTSTTKVHFDICTTRYL